MESRFPRASSRATWALRMCVRLAPVPALVLALPVLARAVWACALAALLALALATPPLVALAAMTWRRLGHPAPATRFEPPRDPASTPPRRVASEEDATRASEGSDSEFTFLHASDDAAAALTAAAAASPAHPVRTVAIIGGGAAGLAALRQMLLAGFDATLFERADDVGGLWTYDDPSVCKVFRSVTQNVTKHHNRFAGFEPPRKWPPYLGHELTLRYLRAFARRFGLGKHVRTRTEVVSCDRTSDGRFELRVRERETTTPDAAASRSVSHPGPELEKTKPDENDAAIASPRAPPTPPTSHRRIIRAASTTARDRSPQKSSSSASSSSSSSSVLHTFDAVCVCSGQLASPNFPNIPGLASFPGSVTHTSEYRVPSAFTGQRVLVIGTGAASGSDVAQDLIGCAESVTVAVRTERWIARRGYVVGRPTLFTRLLMSLPAWLGTLLALYSDAVPYLSPLDPPGLTDSRDFLTAAALGKIRLRRSVRSVRGDLVAFEDGASGRFDAIVFATGFRRRAPFLPEHLRPERTGLYKHAMSPIAPRLGFCLFVLPFGSHFQVAELQAAWLAETWRGGLATPETREMSARADATPALATHEKLADIYRAQYLALLRPALFPLRKETLAGDVLNLARAMVRARYVDPVLEWGGENAKKRFGGDADDSASRDAFFAEASGGDGEDATEGRDGGEAFRARGWLGGTRWRGVVCV